MVKALLCPADCWLLCPPVAEGVMEICQAHFYEDTNPIDDGRASQRSHLRKPSAGALGFRVWILMGHKHSDHSIRFPISQTGLSYYSWILWRWAAVLLCFTEWHINYLYILLTFTGGFSFTKYGTLSKAIQLIHVNWKLHTTFSNVTLPNKGRLGTRWRHASW